MADPRNILIVLAHPDPGSFNHAMAFAARDALRDAGHAVTVSDLCAEGFRADLGRHDMIGAADPEAFHVQAEQAAAMRRGGFAEDIAREQARVAAADCILFQFPLWWGSPPAILKGWAERVMAYGFSYVDGRRFDSGVFQGRRAMISVTTGGTPERFAEGGVYGPIDPILMPFRRLVLEYMGFEVEAPYVSYGVPRSDAPEREAHLAAMAQAAVAMAEKPVARTEAWRTALDEAADGAWRRKA